MDKDLKSMTNKVMMLEGEIHSLLDFARMLDERISEARERYLDINDQLDERISEARERYLNIDDQLHELLRQTIKADTSLEDMEENITQFNQKGADENNDTAEHSEGMFDMQAGVLRKSEDVEAVGGEPDGADLSRLSAHAESEGAAKLPPRPAPEQKQVSRLLRITLSEEDADDLLTLVDIIYNQVLDAKNCSDSDACLELAADYRRLYDNLQNAILKANKPSWLGGGD